MKKLIEQIVKFGIVGIIATLIDMGLLMFLKEIFHMNSEIAAAISFSVSVVFNYIFSMKYVFERKDDMSRKKEFIIFVVLSIIGLGINQGIMIGLKGRLEFLSAVAFLYRFEYMIRKVVATVVVLIWNFVSRKILIEKK
ncbi:MAG: GtrA family protein [Lachnospiraceae bacterium]|nr:GtrA family protein [Lachnospiraceae bacterium]